MRLRGFGRFGVMIAKQFVDQQPDEESAIRFPTLRAWVDVAMK